MWAEVHGKVCRGALTTSYEAHEAFMESPLVIYGAHISFDFKTSYYI